MALELTQDDIYELQNSKDDIKGMLQEIKERMGLDRSPDWMASIECALDDDHNWLGGKPSDGTFQDAIDLGEIGYTEDDMARITELLESVPIDIDGNTLLDLIEKPELPPKGMKRTSEFWQDHYVRYGECTCALDEYLCLLADAEYYSDITEDDMPGWGSLIRSANSVVKSFAPHGAVWKARNLKQHR